MYDSYYYVFWASFCLSSDMHTIINTTSNKKPTISSAVIKSRKEKRLSTVYSLSLSPPSRHWTHHSWVAAYTHAMRRVYTAFSFILQRIRELFLSLRRCFFKWPIIIILLMGENRRWPAKEDIPLCHSLFALFSLSIARRFEFIYKELSTSCLGFVTHDCCRKTSNVSNGQSRWISNDEMHLTMISSASI